MPGGCVVIGVPAKGEPGGFNVVDLVARGLRIVGTNQGDANPRSAIPRLIDLYRRGLLLIEQLVSTFPFKAINRASAASQDGSVVKPVLLMRTAEKYPRRDFAASVSICPKPPAELERASKRPTQESRRPP